ncbi:TIGR03960 family B12-binding radical SAM protein [Cellulosilyticum sp. I15G10I2]|uniref:TIGR03960 family B12-binding radical SAM protein n=1 Tax=Cellulosilyticum sp. I15G10I2 TaxID=1892843 RepID=UPI00085C4831|nr:TIGR03960 family B12-binding radical SAM protein [Cellulosilyticum sp. I15G10I2]
MTQVYLPDSILNQVDKPARYIGGELNSYKKTVGEQMLRFAFCFPDVYEVGMSHLGMQILYHFFNRREDVYCERVFAPWIDMEQLMRVNQVPLFSLETHTPLKMFDFVGFTLQYEMSYTNILNMLDLANIPAYSADRSEEDPFIIAGGPCAYNPEPLAPFVDIFYIGEGEVSYDELFDQYKIWKADGGTKKEFLIKLLDIDGLYIPCFYEETYYDDGTIKAKIPTHPKAKARIQKVIVEDMDNVFYPSTQIVPWIQAVHDRVALEMFRGCIRGCRFCQAGMIYRPVRQKSKEELIKHAKNLLQSTGYEEISLASLSTSDYDDLQNFSEELMDLCQNEFVNISLPSLRIDAFSVNLMQRVQEVRKSSLTFAPEAGSQKLRDVINKNITEEEILEGCKLAFEGGWNRVKLYFMLGLPGETAEDVQEIARLSERIVSTYYQVDKEKRQGGLQLVVSTSCFVPKPFTPFQWASQDSTQSFMEKHNLLRNTITRKQIKYNHHDAKTSILEAVIARGDRRVSRLIYDAYKNGCTFDSWGEHFNYQKWEQAAESSQINFDFYANRERQYDEILPWDHIDIGVTKAFLKKENEKAKEIVTTPNCKEKCSGCGINGLGKGVCNEN